MGVFPYFSSWTRAMAPNHNPAGQLRSSKVLQKPRKVLQKPRLNSPDQYANTDPWKGHNPNPNPYRDINHGPLADSSGSTPTRWSRSLDPLEWRLKQIRPKKRSSSEPPTRSSSLDKDHESQSRDIPSAEPPRGRSTDPKPLNDKSSRSGRNSSSSPPRASSDGSKGDSSSSRTSFTESTRGRSKRQRSGSPSTTSSSTGQNPSASRPTSAGSSKTGQNPPFAKPPKPSRQSSEQNVLLQLLFNTWKLFKI